MSNIRAVVFDVYKTLLDNDTDEESLDSYAFLARWLSFHGVETDAVSLRLRYQDVCADEFAKTRAPYPDFDIGKVFSRILLDTKTPTFDVEAKAREMALLFRILTTKSLSAYSGIHQLLAALKGKVKLGIVSNAQRLFTVPELARFNLLHFFDSVVLSSDVGVRKPDPMIFHALLDALAVPPEAAVFVGDNIFDDVYGAGHVGMKTVWLCRDSTSAGQNLTVSSAPDYLVKGGSCQALSEILFSLLEIPR